MSCTTWIDIFRKMGTLSCVLSGIRRSLLLSILVAASFTSSAYDFVNESLHYEIVYHWGIIWKHAASATLSLKTAPTTCRAHLAARTVSWADKIYPVRDTLVATFGRQDLRPQIYTKISHEDKFYGKDVVKYSYPGDGSTVGHCTVYRKTYTDDTTLVAHSRTAYDMLSVFYALRTCDFDAMKADQTVDFVIFSGRKKENLKIRYVGIDNIKLRDKTPHRAYHLKFRFTQEGKTKSSEDIDAWISTDRRHIPLMIRGKLPIGEVRCFYKAN